MHNGLVRSWCQGKGVLRNEKGELLYKPDDNLWTAGELPKPRPFPTPKWDTLQRLREVSKLPVVIKGVMTAEDAALGPNMRLFASSASCSAVREASRPGVSRDRAE